MNLNPTQARMVACSLEIDGRPDIAASAVVSGHITEFRYRKGVADSPKARRREELQTAITAAINTHGLPALIAQLRTEQEIVNV
jgi:hypothetical protein